LQPKNIVAIATKAAIYIRNALANSGSTDAQKATCSHHATQENLEVDPAHVYVDDGASGSTLDQRPALTAMLVAANSQPRPFDVVLVDTSSRLARSTSVLLTIVEQLMAAGVALIVVDQYLDSRNASFRQLLNMNGMIDEQYLVAFAAKVHRGHQGTVLSGMVPGGHCYGYRNVPVQSVDRDGKASTIGFMREIVPAEAGVIQRIFTLYSTGVTPKEIAGRLNDAGVPTSAARPGAPEFLWSPARIRGILRNATYIGSVIWGRTSKIRNPLTGKRKAVKKPPDEWVIRDAPERRIVSDEQFQQAQRKKGRA